MDHDTIKYRAEVDGLRAIAVIAVLVYHAEIPVLGSNLAQGGYIGVDIFFVISGYLISKLILTEIEQTKSFSFASFYERRARRILPMLLVVMVATFYFSWKFLLPADFVEYSKSVIYSIFFSSNFFFHAATIEYGADSALLKPFLHTWSLSIEEQFYVIFPLILVLLHKRLRRHLPVVLAAVLLVSLIYSDVMSYRDASLSFYFPTTRFWELMVGAMLAFADMRYGRYQTGLLQKTLPVIGILLIVHSIFLFNEETRHPSLYTLIPVLGVALIIYFSNSDDPLGKALGSKPFIAIGLISYSLYLWHFPVFAFGRISETNPSNLDKFAWIALTLVLSVISYFLIERPFRNRQRLRARYAIGAIACVSLALIALNAYSVSAGGFPNRMPEILRAESAVPRHKLEAEQAIKRSGTYKNILLIGDSHMWPLHHAMRHNVSRNGYAYQKFIENGCWPIKDTNRFLKNGKMEEACNAQFQNERLEKITGMDKSIVVIGGRLPLYLSNNFFDNKEGGAEKQGRFWKYFEPEKPATSVKREIRETIKLLSDAGHHVILIYPIPEVGWHVPKTLNARRPRGNLAELNETLEGYLERNPITTSYAVYKERTRESFELLEAIIDPNVHRVYPHRLFCDKQIKGRCVTHDTKRLFYVDDDHLSPRGATMVSNLILDKIREIEASETGK